MECRRLEKSFIFRRKSVFGARSAILSYQEKLWVADHKGTSSSKVLNIPKRKMFRGDFNLKVIGSLYPITGIINTEKYSKVV